MVLICYYISPFHVQAQTFSILKVSLQRNLSNYVFKKKQIISAAKRWVDFSNAKGYYYYFFFNKRKKKDCAVQISINLMHGLYLTEFLAACVDVNWSERRLMFSRM